MQDIAEASNIMTSRYACKVEVREERGARWNAPSDLRLVLRGFMDFEAFDVEAFSGTARRSIQRLFASAA
eukprot:5646563-Pyramimonas_sp.AAC.1